MSNETDLYYLNQEEPNQSCLLALRQLILEQDNNMTETKKWGMPCFCFKKHICFYLWTDKKTQEPYILFVDGNLLDHPMLEVGNRARMKILRINPNKNLNLALIQGLLAEAIGLHSS